MWKKRALDIYIFPSKQNIPVGNPRYLIDTLTMFPNKKKKRKMIEAITVATTEHASKQYILIRINCIFGFNIILI